jgi:hypothetical protein
MNINITLYIKRSGVPADYSAGTYDVSVKKFTGKFLLVDF